MEQKQDSPIVQMLKDGLVSLQYGDKELFYSRDSLAFPSNQWIVLDSYRSNTPYRVTNDEAEAIKWLKGEE